MVAATGELLVSADLQNDARLDPLHREADRRLGFHTVVAAPLRVGPRMVGVLSLRSRARRTFSPDELALVQAFADHAAIALENARLYAAEQHQRQQAEALTDIARDVSAALDRNTVLQRVVEHACRLCRADVATLALCQSGTPRRAPSRRPAIAPTCSSAWSFGRATAWAARSWRRASPWPRSIASPTRGGSPTSRRAWKGCGRRSPSRCSPGTCSSGVLWVNRRSADPFDPSDVSTLEALARHAAVAIQNAALYETAQARATEIQTLRRIGLEVSSSLELPRVLQEIVEAAREITGGDAAFCALVDPGTLDIETVASSGAHSDAFAHYRIEPGQGIGGWFLLHKRPFRTEEYLTDPRFVHAFDDAARTEGIVASVGVPILRQDELIGALWVINRTRRPFTDRDETFLAGLGDHAAVAIVNARIHAQRRRALEELQASQDRLVQTERLRALGEMASGVAHDFNNLLAVILGRVQLLQLRAEDPELRRGLATIEQAAADAAHTVRRIQEFTRTRQTRLFQPVDVPHVVREAIELTRGRWRDEAQVRGVTYTVRTDLADVAGGGRRGVRAPRGRHQPAPQRTRRDAERRHARLRRAVGGAAPWS